MQNQARSSFASLDTGIALQENLSISFQEEAARYALLRRLAPAIRHHMVGEFQPMGMISAMMDRRLQAAEPNLPSIRENCATLGNLSRAAASSCINLMTWVAPKSGANLSFGKGVEECLSLLGTEFRFKGFVVTNEVGELDAEVASGAVRTVVSAALIALSDQAQGPAELVLRAQAQPSSIDLSIDLRPVDGDAENGRLAEYRTLVWADVEALAAAESVELTHSKDSVGLRFTRALSPS